MNECTNSNVKNYYNPWEDNKNSIITNNKKSDVYELKDYINNNKLIISPELQNNNIYYENINKDIKWIEDIKEINNIEKENFNNLLQLEINYEKLKYKNVLSYEEDLLLIKNISSINKVFSLFNNNYHKIIKEVSDSNNKHKITLLCEYKQVFFDILKTVINHNKSSDFEMQKEFANFNINNINKLFN